MELIQFLYHAPLSAISFRQLRNTGLVVDIAQLSKNLHETLKIESENEMIVIRVNMLESELRRIKEKLNYTA